MATSSKAPCATCGNKAPGIFRCEGCVQVFCRKHLNEHRDHLSHQLDEIVVEHDTIQQTIIENKSNTNNKHPVLKQIDQWEKDSIAKIQQMAKEARDTANQLIGSDTVSKELYSLAERLQKARTDDDYIETDLRTWTETLRKLRESINPSNPSISIQEDRKELVVGKIRVSTMSNKKIEITRQRERFGSVYGDASVDNNGLRAVHNNWRNGTAHVRGTGEYSLGKHYIRFLFEKGDLEFITDFSIVSKLAVIGEKTKYKRYGWSSQDDIYSGTTRQTEIEIEDLQGCKRFTIELELDCDNRKIAYVNLETRNRRRMNVDITQCPFPWQIQVYLFACGDSVTFLD